MDNLYIETIRVLAENGKTEDDIRWVGMRNGYRLDLSGGLKKLFDFEYDDGYGMAEIRIDMVVVGDDWWLERYEEDGAEWWEFKTMPQMPEAVIQDPMIKNIANKAYFWHRDDYARSYQHREEESNETNSERYGDDVAGEYEQLD